MKKIRQKVDELYKQLNIKNRISFLDINSFKIDGEYPRLKAKANECRHFLPVLAKLLELDGSTGLYQKVRHEMLSNLMKFYSLIDTTDMFLELGVAKEAKATINNFLKCYSWLCNNAVQQGQRKWQMTVKFHYLAHAADELVWANPKHGSTYGAESFVGKITRIGVSCLMGRSPWEVGGLLMDKVQVARAVHHREFLV